MTPFINSFITYREQVTGTPISPGRILNLRQLLLDGRSKFPGQCSKRIGLSFIALVLQDLVKAGITFMHFVKPKLVIYPKKDEHGAGYSQRKTENVQKGITLVFY